MKFTDINKVSEKQRAFCKKLDLDVAGNTIGVASAKIYEAIGRHFWGRETPEVPTEKQIMLASKYGVDISKMSRLLGNAVIDDIMSQLNVDAIKKYKLMPGVRVRKVYEETGQEYVISSMQDDGTVYFKGGKGHKAWARNLENAEKS